VDASDDRLLALAGSVSEGAAVDWRRAESEASSDRERALVRELRFVEDVALAWRLGEAEPLPLPARWGSLEVLELLGSGGFGDVYRAFDPRLRRHVALKLLRVREGGDAGRGSLLLDEGQTLAQVRHPNVVTVYGADRVDGRFGLWMELVGGHTLAERLRREGPMTADDAGSAGACLAQALGAMHAAGVVHGDVKAQNVMVEGSRFVLMDPGAGRAGTPAYLAPELQRGGATTPRSDVYAMGVLLHHALTRELPSDRPLRQARPDVPLPFMEVIERALHGAPERRYADGNALEAAIRRAFGESGRDRRRLFVGAVLGGLALSIGLGLLWPERPAGPPLSPRPVRKGTPAPPPQFLVEKTGATDPTPQRGERPLVDPFLRPLGPPSLDGPATGSPGRDGPYTIQVALEPVESRASVALRVHASEPLYLYVVSEGDGDRCALVYPLPGQERTNPLPAGSPARVPGPSGWRRPVLGPVLVAIAARERLLEFENELRSERVPAGGAPVESVSLGAATLARLRKAAGVDPSARLFESARPASGRVEIVRGLWIRRIELGRAGSH
jgi:serine/threonine protein kinase